MWWSSRSFWSRRADAQIKASENAIPPQVRTRLDNLQAEVEQMQKEKREMLAKLASAENNAELSAKMKEEWEAKAKEHEALAATAQAQAEVAAQAAMAAKAEAAAAHEVAAAAEERANAEALKSPKVVEKIVGPAPGEICAELKPGGAAVTQIEAALRAAEEAATARVMAAVTAMDERLTRVREASLHVIGEKVARLKKLEEAKRAEAQGATLMEEELRTELYDKQQAIDALRAELAARDAVPKAEAELQTEMTISDLEKLEALAAKPQIEGLGSTLAMTHRSSKDVSRAPSVAPTPGRGAGPTADEVASAAAAAKEAADAAADAAAEAEGRATI